MDNIPISPGGHILSFDTYIYSIEAIKKTAYKFADRTSVVISSSSDSKILVTFNFTGQNAKDDPQQVISDFCNELLDQDLRDVIKKETGALRNVLIAHAFSRSSLAEES
jgi:His-Xaa-Ser system protein HxsD